MPTLTRKATTIAFAVLLVGMIFFPVLTVSMKGDVRSFAMINGLSGESGLSLHVAIAVLVPLVALVMTRVSARWQRTSAIFAAVGVVELIAGLGSITDSVRSASMGMAGGRVAWGFWVMLLGFLAVAVLNGFAAFRPATLPPVPQEPVA